MLWLFSVFGAPISLATPNAPSGGRVESLCKGLSGMDAARAAMGQGWPFAACPWSNEGTREPDEVGPDGRGKPSWLLLGRLPEVTRRKGGTGIGNNMEAASSRRRQVTRLPPQWWMKRASSTLRIADIPVVGWTTRSLSTMVRYNHRSRMSRNTCWR